MVRSSVRARLTPTPYELFNLLNISFRNKCYWQNAASQTYIQSIDRSKCMAIGNMFHVEYDWSMMNEQFFQFNLISKYGRNWMFYIIIIIFFCSNLIVVDWLGVLGDTCPQNHLMVWMKINSHGQIIKAIVHSLHIYAYQRLNLCVLLNERANGNPKINQ